MNPDRIATLALDRFCLEAVRCQCLQSVLEPGEPFLAPKVQFSFRPTEALAAAPSAPCSSC